jgi:alkanesulfonate monooxygenase SsuD/methylene tetrahydromethanopterin reductase-like flavin-dependent oxidoreductase (luciferase family)
MTDYGRALEFGANADPLADQPHHAAAIARLADTTGLDLVAVQDHPYNRHFLDTWTLLATLATQTTRVRLFPDVADLPLRPPAMLAKATATLDVLSGGRVELGLGAGALWDAIGAYGGPVRSPGEAVQALEEAVHVIRLLWSEQRGVRHAGRYYQLEGAQPGPRPAHAIGIWLGVLGPRMLALTGRLADGVVWSSSYVPVERLAEMHARIDAAAAAAGRAPRDVRRVYNLMGSIGPEQSASEWVEQLAGLVLEHGLDTFIFWPLDDPLRQLEVFARDVVPRVRESVARQRAQRAE